MTLSRSLWELPVPLLLPRALLTGPLPLPLHRASHLQHLVPLPLLLPRRLLRHPPAELAPDLPAAHRVPAELAADLTVHCAPALNTLMLPESSLPETLAFHHRHRVALAVDHHRAALYGIAEH